MHNMSYYFKEIPKWQGSYSC